MTRNLIKNKIGTDGQPTALAIPNPASEHCGEEAADFARSISAIMEVKPSEGTAKVPSVMSPTYSFYIYLNSATVFGAAAVAAGLADGKRRAQAQFRGIAAALLLRETLGLRIHKEAFPLNTRSGIRGRFGSLVQVAPGFNQPPWNTHLHYLTLESGGVREPLAILSPYTLICPAATTMRRCRSLYWYTEQGEWLDPTVNNPKFAGLNPRTIAVIRTAIYRWLSQVLQPGQPLAWPNLIQTLDAKNLINEELQSWRRDIEAAEPGIVADNTLAVQMLPAAEHLGGPHPLLDQYLIPAEAPPINPADPPRLTNPSLLTDLPVHKGRLLVSKQLVSDSTRRICGMQMGNSSFAPCIDGLPLMGDQLALTDGVRYFIINYPYLNVEKAFLDHLYQIADGDVSTSIFKVLQTTNPPTNSAEYWLLPVVKEALNYLDIKGVGLAATGIEKFPTCQRRQDGQNDNRVVTISIGGNAFMHEYSKQKRSDIFHPNLLDIRIWPQIMAEEIDHHYWRIRQLPKWELSPIFLTKKGNEIISVNWVDPWSDGILLPFPVPAHINAKFYKVPVIKDTTLNGDTAPVGVEFLNRGVLLLELPALTKRMRRVDCILAVDFGTSNTCVTITPVQNAGNHPPTPVRFEIQTASLHGKPAYYGIPGRNENGFTEGGAPVFDFPIKYMDEEKLADADFFPTLFATFTPGELELRPPAGAGAAQRLDTAFRLSYGRLYPRNVMFDSGYIRGLLRGSPMVDGLPTGTDTRPVYLFDDIKHDNDRYRRAFLWDLAMLVKVHASRENQQITEARFSYPRAFPEEKLVAFAQEAADTFIKALKIQQRNIKFMTESDAVYRHTLTQDTTDHLVLDIGGGTTDFLVAFPNNEAQCFQASYNLAAGVLNNYFAKSKVFQHVFRNVVANAGLDALRQDRMQEVAKLVDRLDTVEGKNITNYGRQGFFGLLSLLNDEQYGNVFNGLRSASGSGGFSDEQVQRAVRGFSYSVLLLYGGLAYSAGLLMKERQAQSAVLNIDLIGNGSKLYLLLQNIAPNAQEAVDNLIAYLLTSASGMQPQRVRVAFHANGKTFVSMGLSSNQDKASPQIGYLSESFNYLSGQAQRPPTASNQSELSAFIHALSLKLPGGSLVVGGRTYPLVPFCSGSIRDELTALLPGLQVAFESAEGTVAKQCTKDFNASINPNNAEAVEGFRDSARAREPLFVIHLRTLLEHIGIEYGAKPTLPERR